MSSKHMDVFTVYYSLINNALKNINLWFGAALMSELITKIILKTNNKTGEFRSHDGKKEIRSVSISASSLVSIKCEVSKQISATIGKIQQQRSRTKKCRSSEF